MKSSEYYIIKLRRNKNFDFTYIKMALICRFSKRTWKWWCSKYIMYAFECGEEYLQLSHGIIFYSRYSYSYIFLPKKRHKIALSWILKEAGKNGSVVSRAPIGQYYFNMMDNMDLWVARKDAQEFTNKLYKEVFGLSTKRKINKYIKKFKNPLPNEFPKGKYY